MDYISDDIEYGISGIRFPRTLIDKPNKGGRKVFQTVSRSMLYWRLKRFLDVT